MYYSVIVPPVPEDMPGTVWHDPNREMTLSRGSFRTWAKAYMWARAHLEGYPYSIKEYH